MSMNTYRDTKDDTLWCENNILQIYQSESVIGLNILIGLMTNEGLTGYE